MNKLSPSCRPPTSRGEQRRDAFLQAARELFLEKGYAGTSIDEVVQRTGGSKASVYKYFGNKENLFAAMFSELCRSFLARLDIPNDISTNLEQTLTQFAERVLSAFAEPERVAMLRAIIAEASRFPDLAELIYATGPKHSLGLLAELLQRHHDAGLIECPHPHIAAIQFMEMIKGHVQWRSLLGLSSFPDHLNRELYIQQSVRVFLKGYAAPC